MELNWPPQNRWQRHGRSPGEQPAPYAIPSSLAPISSSGRTGNAEEVDRDEAYEAAELTENGPVESGPAPGGTATGELTQDELMRDELVPDELTTGGAWPGETGEHPAGASTNGADQEKPRDRPPLPWLRRVSFRSRISVLVGMAVGISVALASLVSYLAVSHQLEQQVTVNLQTAVTEVPNNVRVFQGPECRRPRSTCARLSTCSSKPTTRSRSSSTRITARRSGR